MRLNRTVMLPVMLACSAGITRNEGTEDSSLRGPVLVTPDSAVYAALLTSVFRGTIPDTIVLRDSSMVFTDPPSTATVEKWRREFEELRRSWSPAWSK